MELRVALTGLALAFGVMGVVFVEGPLLLFPFPLAFGIGGLLLLLVARGLEAEGWPVWMPFAAVACIASIAIGVMGHVDFQEGHDALERIGGFLE